MDHDFHLTIRTDQEHYYLTVRGHETALVFIDTQAVNAFGAAIASNNIEWLGELIQGGWIFRNIGGWGNAGTAPRMDPPITPADPTIPREVRQIVPRAPLDGYDDMMAQRMSEIGNSVIELLVEAHMGAAITLGAVGLGIAAGQAQDVAVTILYQIGKALNNQFMVDVVAFLIALL